MHYLQPFRVASLLLLAILLCSARSSAQAPFDPSQLPARTSFYLYWHGSPTGDVRKNNSLYALWDDPQFSSAIANFAESSFSATPKSQEKPALTRQEIAQYVTLLDNPFLIGYLRRPETPAAPKSTDAKAAPAPKWNGMFFIYDRSGKEDLLSKAVMRSRASEKDIPKLTPVTLAGVSALKVEQKSGVSYWAEFGKYAVSTNEPSVFEEIVNLLNSKPESRTLSQATTFQEAQPLLNGGVLEFFLDISGAERIALDSPNPLVAQAKPLLAALKLETLHSIAGHISLEGAKTHLQAAILGDTVSGGLFDLWADGQATPASMSYISADTISYTESQFNLLGIYGLLKNAFSPPGSAPSTANALEAAAETRIGMTLPDALGVPTGEIARLQTSPTLDDEQQILLLGIRDKSNALKLARSLMGDRITSERNEGDAIFLKVSLQGGQTSKGVAQWNFYYLAMTPTVLLGSSKNETLRRYVGQAPLSSSVALPQPILASRERYPEKLNGFSYIDLQKLDWAALQAKWAAEANKTAQTAKSTDAASQTRKITDWLSQVNAEVFSRHLHTMSGASWKDAKGVHFDEWLE